MEYCDSFVHTRIPKEEMIGQVGCQFDLEPPNSNDIAHIENWF